MKFHAQTSLESHRERCLQWEQERLTYRKWRKKFKEKGQPSGEKMTGREGRIKEVVNNPKKFKDSGRNKEEINYSLNRHRTEFECIGY